MSQGMKSQQFQYSNYSPTEFEQFRNAVQLDGFTVTQNTIDTVSGHIGSLTYLTGFYNRNQQVLTVTVKTSPWQSLQDGELEGNVNRVVARNEEAVAKVNSVPVKTPPTAEVKSLGTNKNIVQPAAPLATTSAALKPAPVQPTVSTQKPVPTQTPKPVEVKPAEVATTTPTK